MIEMLGVLAIIGVLSVGGIAGYSKAMEKFKINKTIDHISQIIANIQTVYAGQTTFNGLDNATAIKLGIVPDDMETSGSSINHAFDGDGAFLIPGMRFPTVLINGGGSYASILFTDMTEEACIALGTHDWENDIDGLQGIVIGNISGVGIGPSCTEGGSYDQYSACKGHLPISPDIAADYCSRKIHVYYSFAIRFHK